MPSRPAVIAIVLFWLAATAWLIHREIWPRLRTGEPPPFSIDLADEALRAAPRVNWLIKRQNKTVGRLRTWVSYHAQDDTFELHSEVAPKVNLQVGPIQLTLTRANNTYRVTREGHLRGLHNEGEIAISWLNVEAGFQIEGEVRDGVFWPKGSATLGGAYVPLELPEVAVSRQGSMLNPLQPFNRIVGIRPGQHWQLPLFDPLKESLVAMLRKNPGADALLDKLPQSHLLRAEVSGPRILEWDRRQVECLVIRYESDDGLGAETWVRADDGLVLKQEASLWGDKLVLEREPR